MSVELLDPPEERVHLATIPHPFSMDRTLTDLDEGPTIADLIRISGVPPWAAVRVFVNQVFIPPAYYTRVRPKRGSCVTIRAVPRGGGGNSDKNTGMLVLGIVLIIVGILLIGTPVGGYLIAVGISLTLTAVINFLVPPPTPPKLRPLSGLGAADAESPTLSIAGQRNDARPYGVAPRVLGRHRIFPPYAALPFTEIVGSDQYLRLLFAVGIGETAIEDLRIGETSIENFSGVELEIRTGAAGEPPITLYPRDVFEDPLSIALTFAGGGQIRTSRNGATELSVSVAYPQGLIEFLPTGGKKSAGVSITVEYRLVGQTAFVRAPESPIVAVETRQALIRAGTRWKPQRPAGPYGAAAWSVFGLASVTASRLNDGVLNVIAFDADAAPAGSWLMLDSATPIECGRVVVTSAGTGANCTWDIQESDDLVTWVTVVPGFSTGAAATESTEWVPRGPHRYRRLFKTNAAAAGPDYYEVEWWATAAGAVSDQYDVRLTRTTADATNANLLDLSVWSALRTFGVTPPVTMPTGVPLALVAMRIKATDQLNGVVETFNCIASSRILDYATYAGTVLADQPLGYWRLGEILAAPTAFDASGHGRSGLYVGAPTLGATGLLTGDTDTAMGCDGTDDKITTFTGLSAIDMGGMSFTVEALVKATTLTGNRGIVHKGDGLEFTSAHLGWSLIRAGSVFRFTRAFGSGSPTLVDSPTISAGVTYHVAVVYDRFTAAARMYLNGAIVATVSMPSTVYADTYGLEISQASDTPWQGTLDEVAIYPTALSAARIAAHAAAAAGTREWVVQRTSNPASLYRTVLQDPGNARPVGDARMDLPQIQAWHAECAAAGRSCNLVVDYKTTVFELLRVIASCGRGTPTMNDGKYAAVRDLTQTVPVQHFTVRNTRQFNGHRAMLDPIHALKMRFMDPGAGWQQSERIVYDDGYSEKGEVPGTVAATRFEVIELHGVTDPDLAWRMGRYNLAVARLRPESYRFETDIEHLVARRGDLVLMAHDITEWGLAQGRIKSVATSGGQATSITLDEILTMEASKSYAVRVRLSDGTSVVAPIVTAPGEQTAVTFVTPVVAPLPAAGDLTMFGLSTQETVRAIISRIEPGQELSAVLTLVDDAPGVRTADQGTIPAWDPQMTRPAIIELVPPTPLITSVVSDETVLLRDLDGSLRSRIVITLQYQATSNVRADSVEVRWRRTGSVAPFESLPPLPPDTETVSLLTGVEDGAAYDIRVRTVNKTGPSSPWAEVFGHVVIGKSTPPLAPVNPRLESGHLLWDYPTPPPDLEGFEVRRSPGAIGNWMTALEMHVGLVFAPFDLGTIYGQWTLLVAAVDSSGNASAPASLTATFPTPTIHNQVATQSYHPTFAGSITNGSVISNELRADQLTTGFWTQDGNLFWSPVGSTLFWQGTYKEMTYDFTYTTGANAAGARIVFTAITVVAIGWALFYRVGTSGDYLPWPGVLENILASQEYDFRLVTFAGVVQGIVSALTLVVDADDLEELHQNVATAVTTGSRLTLQRAYRAIKAVEATVLASGAETAITAIAKDQQNTAGAGNGPLIQSFDAAGAIVAGHVNATVKGY